MFTRAKIENIFCYTLASFFFVSVFYSIAKCFQMITMRDLIGEYSNFLALVLFFTSLITIQAILAYGYAKKRHWVKHTVTIHLISIFLTGLVLLPILSLQHLIKSTLMNGALFTMLTLITWYLSVLQYSNKINYWIIGIYTVAISSLVYIQLFYLKI
jgi:hypothetical protein